MYGLIIGTILLSVMLLKTCTNKANRRQRAPVMAPATQHYSYRQMPVRAPSVHEIKNQIEIHKSEIKRLEHLAKQAEEI